MSGKYLVLYQREIAPLPDYTPARVAIVFKLQAAALEDALKQVRYGFDAWAVPFKELPPKHMMFKACEEAVREGRAQALPHAVAPKKGRWDISQKRMVVNSDG